MFNSPRALKLYILIILSVFVLSCEVNIPVKEVIAAKTAVEDAKKFGAEKYSTDELKKAITLLGQCHDYIVDQDTDKAKKAAEDALAAALEAEKKSLPSYASEQLKKSEEAYREADMAYAEKFSPEKFNEAGRLKVEAKGLYDKGELKKSAVVSGQSIDLSVAAKNDALQNSSFIEDEINKTNTKLADLKKDKNKSAAENNLSDAETLINKAKQDVNDRDYKSSLQEIEMAKKELDEAAKLIKKQKVASAVQSLRAELDQMRKKDDLNTAKDDLDKAIVELNAAESSLEQNNITDAELRVDQAEKLIRGSDIKMKKGKAAAAVEKAEKLLVQARNRDKDNKYRDNLDKAEKIITEAKSFINAEKFSEATGSAEEAETIITAVMNSMDTASADVAVKAEAGHEGEKAAGEGESKETATDTSESKTEERVGDTDRDEDHGRYYVVQWRKKKTDCLWRIAEKVYKDAKFWPAIYLANRDQIKDPDLIFPGQKFTIPPKPKKRPSYRKAKQKVKAKSK